MIVEWMYYLLALIVIVVIVLAFYHTIQHFKTKHRHLDERELQLRQKLK
ncbi:hypothetical protein ACE3MZ_09825 [Paenibacillus sp. WLX1005]